ncbi:metal-dependent hydrolase [Cellulomonas xiejunii]|uniref:metal-dependent hydrolase n=1 Tax=Cellulomonas xiejunii TaxID=2968083 RepID=UPI001D0F0505|nr:metal-dependent hydrolase [Cellulomonas xiejunii]MCC2315004.1 metal-dependent hydrolase [Cellulomonas xiejunii]
MKGAHHALCGAAAWVAVASTAPYTLGWYPVSSLGIVTGALVCAGAALAPDADHHDATIAHSLPPVSEWVCDLVGRLAGGHRNGTHSVLGIAVLTGIAWAAGTVTMHSDVLGDLAVGAGTMSLLLVAFAARALRLARRRLDAWALALALAGFITVAAPTEWDWLPVAVGLGATVHVAGDMLTGGGVPLLWPWEPRPPRWWRRAPVLNDLWSTGGNFAFPVLGTTGSWRERLLVAPLTAYAAYGMGAAVVVGSLTALGHDPDVVMDRVWDAANVLVGTATVVGTIALTTPPPT